MKKVLFSLLVASVILISSVTCSAQTGMIQIYSGFGRTAYSMKEYHPASYVPVGIRADIGANGIAIGADFWTSVADPKFDISDSTGTNKLRNEKISDTYLGAMLRAQMSDDPRDFGLVL